MDENGHHVSRSQGPDRRGLRSQYRNLHTLARGGQPGVERR
jgi:hypothetical protein